MVKKVLRIVIGFAKSKLGKLVADMSQIPHRPSDILGIEGSPLERLLWDISILSEMEVPYTDLDSVKGLSVKDKIRMKRRRLGVI